MAVVLPLTTFYFCFMNIVITGATKGIGRAIAEKFTAEGFNLAVCSRNNNDLKAFKKELLEKHPDIEVLTKVADMRKKKEVLAFANFIKKNLVRKIR